MSTIGTNAEDLILNADGSGSDIKFKSNGTEVGSISDGGVMTATSFAGSGANLTGVGVAGISSSADATAITIDSNEQVGINQATPLAKLQISATGSNNTTFAQGLLIGEGSGSNNASAFYHDASGSTKAVVENRYDNSSGSIEFRLRGSGTTVTPLKIIADGRGVSEFTARAWANYNDTTIYDSHNISSMTDVETGMSYANFTSAMPNASYVVQATAYSSNCDKHGPYIADAETGRVKILSLLKTNCDYADRTTHFVIFGDA